MFAKSGLMTAPCGVPSSVSITRPSSSTPAISHLAINRMIGGRHPTLDETDQPILADLVEKGLNVTIEHPVDPPPPDPERERIQRLMLAALRSETVADSAGTPIHRSASGLPPPRPGRSCPLWPQCRAVAVYHPLSVRTSGATAALGTLLYGRVHAGSLGLPQGALRIRSTSSRRHRALQSSSVRRSLRAGRQC